MINIVTYRQSLALTERQIVTASADKTVRVWDVRSGKQLTEPLKHDGEIDSVQFSPDGKRIVTASTDKNAQGCGMWQSGKQLLDTLEHHGDLHSAEFSPDGRRIVTASVRQVPRGSGMRKVASNSPSR